MSAAQAWPTGVRIVAIGDKVPLIHPTAWVAPGVTLIGDVRIGPESAVFYGAVLRADQEAIRIGRQSNIQDNCVVHCDPGRPAILGDRVSVGHHALIHGCRVGDDVLVGMSTTLLNECVIGDWSLVAAGAVVLEGARVPENSLVAGVPARVGRELGEDDRERIRLNAAHYLEISALHRDGARLLQG